MKEFRALYRSGIPDDTAYIPGLMNGEIVTLMNQNRTTKVVVNNSCVPQSVIEKEGIDGCIIMGDWNAMELGIDPAPYGNTMVTLITHEELKVLTTPVSVNSRTS